MAKCTNRFLPEGYKLTDETGATIAVLENGEFKLWQAGSWKFKMEFRPLKRMRALRAARRANALPFTRS